ncbi:hypothetical protein H6G11_17365 [Cyanobacterium aponinum FACHB-4101]|uniref:hypothetical protein n=1 Tax=Cyanobacterium aponinum TaxID=379064 RepID=UPI001680BCB3|nr:hypothetical protein [Cyanobacterium aponinum]MBD2396016.1 hypothetical protein [Cyanobacterium aponinum FACHB-4101]
MKIVQTIGEIQKGELKTNTPLEMNDGEVDIVIIAPNEPDEWETMRQQAKDNSYDSREKIMDLIHQVKLEMLEEKGGENLLSN